jgi:hypothetical protein
MHQNVDLIVDGSENLVKRPPPEVRVRFPELPDFMRSNWSGTVPTQTREYN